MSEIPQWVQTKTCPDCQRKDLRNLNWPGNQGLVCGCGFIFHPCPEAWLFADIEDQSYNPAPPEFPQLKGADLSDTPEPKVEAKPLVIKRGGRRARH
jgi:hypothetical protein